MQIKNCLKFWYRGQLRFVVCDANTSYEDILELVAKTFRIPEVHIQRRLQITSEQGYVFEKNVFEYFILLFPRPQIVFFVNLQQSSTVLEAHKQITRSTAKPDTRVLFGYSKLNNKRHLNELDYEAVPVCRQNCFLGDLPKTGEAASARRAKRVRLMKPNIQPKKSSGTTIRI